MQPMTASLRKERIVVAGTILMAVLVLLPPVQEGGRLAFNHGFNAFQATYFDSQSFRFLCM
jgi:hypothetical protein